MNDQFNTNLSESSSYNSEGLASSEYSLLDYSESSSMPSSAATSSSITNLKGFNYSYINTTARIALYDDFKSAPRVLEIKPSTTSEYIEKLASTIYEHSQLAGGSVPYTVIREVTENFIHAQFNEVVVSILNKGNTIRFSDQGPGITNKEKAHLPGFTSATDPMKQYIRGVGSGLPIVKDYLAFSNGTITIEDNLKTGAVVTISLTNKEQEPAATAQTQTSVQSLIPPLNQREKDFLTFFSREGALGVTDLSHLTGVPQSSTYVVLSHLEEYGLIEKTVGQKRMLTELGFKIASSF